MPRALLWAPVGAVILAAAVFGLRSGASVAGLTETEVINTYAARYLQTRAREGIPATPSECHALPGGAPGVWITVVCGAPGSAYVYHIDRRGRLVGSQDPESGPRT